MVGRDRFVPIAQQRTRVQRTTGGPAGPPRHHGGAYPGQSSTAARVRSTSMTTDVQIAANRANAQKSTGPRTAAGRLKSSRNAFRHGLSLPLPLDVTTSAKADAIGHALTHDQASEEQRMAAAEL